MTTEFAKIRPAGRLLSTIGEDLIGDVNSALVELVKNAFDADATKVDLLFIFPETSDDSLRIEIVDDGHGMSRDTVLNAWLVPATKNKVSRLESPNGRLLQGKKGIGRYAAAILGQEMIMKTTDAKGEQTEILINWSSFEHAEFLDDVEILVTSSLTKAQQGTSLFITANGSKKNWGRSELGNLTKDLRKLKSPIQNLTETVDDFAINLAFINSPFEEYNNQIFEIERFPIIDLFDYRISGTINSDGHFSALYENKTEDFLPEDTIVSQVSFRSHETLSGPIAFDFRIFDRDPESISNLIDKGLIDPISKFAVSKRDAKLMLDEVYGVNLYREGFRIRPYGNGGIDWLNLDKDRIQNFSLRVSNNQVVGFVNIKPERVSNLEEKSSRDGLKENSYYWGLVRSLKTVLGELEVRRFSYRQKTGKGRQGKSVTKEIQNLFDYSILTNEISKKLDYLKINEEVIKEIASIVHKDAERKTKLLENIQNTIAIYQGQATLGKIVTVLLHEGRKPVNYFKQQSANLPRWLTHYKAKRDWDDDLYNDILDRLQNFQQHSEFLADLFKRLDPLAKQNKGSKKDFTLKPAILKATRIFEGQFDEMGIDLQLDCNASLQIHGWEEDIIIAIANLVENSIYWLDVGNPESKIISINVTSDQDIIIHYKDSGPGIDESIIQSGLIFEPGFSKKLEGTGLGLPIAGEAIDRLNGNIVAHHSLQGAYFTVEIKK